ncbi:hypothetical protein [Actinomadura spongiicola]|uniref:hypothetical protein n=1 Tax=Actinomadura spongiicola TaxID=2303421 RepID=UPI001F3191CE|nr:hypothetical protein [Actinomadura spongiicola]
MHKNAGIPDSTDEQRNANAFALLGNLEGRPVLAVSRLVEGWLRQEIMFVPDSYTFHGARTVAAKDHSADGWTIKRAPWRTSFNVAPPE